MELQSLNWTTLDDRGGERWEGNMKREGTRHDEGGPEDDTYLETWSLVSFPSSTDTFTLSLTCSAASRAPANQEELRAGTCTCARLNATLR